MSAHKDVESGMSEEQQESSTPLLLVGKSGHDENNRPSSSFNPQVLNINDEKIMYSSKDHQPPEGPLEMQPTESKINLNTVAGAASNVLKLKKWTRNTKLKILNFQLLMAIDNDNVLEVERILKAGANPNIACEKDLLSACHIATFGSEDSLSLLIRYGAETQTRDRMGRTPLHFAAIIGNPRMTAVLLNIPEDLLQRIDSDGISSELDEDFRKMRLLTEKLVNVRCGNLGVEEEVEEVPAERIYPTVTYKSASPNMLYHNFFEAGWTPLHAASFCARRHCVRLLLAAGADPNIGDVTGRTALDVAGSAYYYDDGRYMDSPSFTEVVKMLLDAGGTHNTMKLHGINDVDTPLHTAVELRSTDTIQELLKAGVAVDCLNASGLTPLHICVRKKLADTLSMLVNYAESQADMMSAAVDMKDERGLTLLHTAVKVNWMSGFRFALEAGGDVTLKDKNGQTVLHWAAQLGNIEMLSEILSVENQNDFVNCTDYSGETALYKAVFHNIGAVLGRDYFQCIKSLLNNGASVDVCLQHPTKNFLVSLSIQGDTEILRLLLESNESEMKKLISTVTFNGLGLIHLAILDNHVRFVEMLLNNNANVKLKTEIGLITPLHIAAQENYSDIVQLILEFDKTTIDEADIRGWLPMHTAAYNGSRDVLLLLLKAGGDLSSAVYDARQVKTTLIEMIVKNITKPTEFLEEVLDSYIFLHKLIYNPSEIVVDYDVILSKECPENDMRVIEALLDTGNENDQYRLLHHPLIESFLHLRWNALLPLFRIVIILYILFLSAVTIFVVSVFYYNDNKKTTPIFFNETVWGCLVYISIILIIVQEVLCKAMKSRRYFLLVETWVKLGSIGLAAILPPAVFWSDGDWIRHVATLTLWLSWLEITLLLSRFPNWGYYVYMFTKVAANVIKILITFVFILIGFALSFMVQFHSQEPFDNPWAAFVKTMVMMTSEFDYMSLFGNKKKDTIDVSFIIVRLVFFIFLILGAVALMNLIVGVAVNDINNLERLGDIERIVKQVQFLVTVNRPVDNKFLRLILPKTTFEVPLKLPLQLNDQKCRYNTLVPLHIREAIFEKLKNRKTKLEDILKIQKKLNNIYENNKDNIYYFDNNTKTITKKINIDDKIEPSRVDDVVTEVKDNNIEVDDLRVQLKALNVKMDQMAQSIKTMNQLLIWSHTQNTETSLNNL